jgi:single-stranded-DNA-specific exonuclease
VHYAKTIKRRIVKHDLTFPHDLPDVLKRIYSTRAMENIEQLERPLKHLLPFSQLLHIEVAVAHLYHALQQQKRIMIIGDFDTDGATSTTLALTALRAFGAKHVHYLVPNRFEYSYGLSPEIVEVASAWQPDYLITVDNGIASCSGVDVANAKGMKVIVTDHHLPGDALPAAAAIVNPNQPGCLFPSKNLAGVGVIFYVMLALRRYLSDQGWFASNAIPEPNMAQFLDLVALGTVADLVPLDYNNRVLVYQGIQRIRAGHVRPGIAALLTVSRREAETVSAADFGFSIAPRLNAAGRLDDMSVGIECLLASSMSQALPLARQLDEFNKERRVIEASMHREALNYLDKLQLTSNQRLPYGLCLFEATWHQGVIGILAGRIKEKFHRPVIAFAAVENGLLKGSARSIQGVHIRDVLDEISKKHPDLLIRFGGHAMAAGLTLLQKDLEKFTETFHHVLQTKLTEDDLQGIIYSDGELANHECSLDIAKLLEDAGPWGQAFPEPLFDGVFSIIEQRVVGDKHLKLNLQCDQSHKTLDAIAFNIDLNAWPNYRCKKIRLAYRLNINCYNGIDRLQLIAEHLEVVE